MGNAELLAGSGAGRKVWRTGNTVRRETGPWTPAVHELLRHLEAVGFDGAPRVQGIDEHGREVLTFVEGEDGRRVRHTGPILVAVARLIRRFHDAVREFRPRSDSVWRSGTTRGPLDEEHIVCHNDLAPYNTVYDSTGPMAIIDWDLAGPAPVVSDVVHAAWTFVPLYTDEDCARVGIPVRPRGPRLGKFCDGYGLRDRDTFLDTLRAHLLTLDSSVARRSVPFLDTFRPAWERHLM